MIKTDSYSFFLFLKIEGLKNNRIVGPINFVIFAGTQNGQYYISDGQPACGPCTSSKARHGAPISRKIDKIVEIIQKFGP